MTPAEAKKRIKELLEDADGRLGWSPEMSENTGHILMDLISVVEILAEQLPQGEDHEK